MEFSRQEYWSGLAFPFPRDLPDSGINPGTPTLQVGSLPSESPGKPIKDTSVIILGQLSTMKVNNKMFKNQAAVISEKQKSLQLIKINGKKI